MVSTHLYYIFHGGVRLWDKKCNSGLILIYFSVSITSTKLWESNYSDYQQYLYDRIKGFIENSVTPIGYRSISKIFNYSKITLSESNDSTFLPTGSVFQSPLK